MPQDNTVLMEGVRINNRNFSGREEKYNQEGNRNFLVLLDPDTAEKMLADGWAVKYFKPREDEEEDGPPQAFLRVVLKYRDRSGKAVRPPRVVLITSRNRQNLDETNVEMLDWVNIINVDLIVRPYEWSMADGRGGINAYLQSMYVTIEEDPLERKYAELDEGV